MNFEFFINVGFHIQHGVELSLVSVVELVVFFREDGAGSHGFVFCDGFIAYAVEKGQRLRSMLMSWA